MIQIGDGAYNTEKLIGFAPSGTIGYASSNELVYNF